MSLKLSHLDLDYISHFQWSEVYISEIDVQFFIFTLTNEFGTRKELVLDLLRCTCRYKMKTNHFNFTTDFYGEFFF